MKQLCHLAAFAAMFLAADAGTAHAGLLSFWNFDEGGGTTAFDSAGAVNGTLEGSASFTGGGVQGGAVSIAGVGSLVSMGDNFNFNNGSAYTVQAWVKLAPGDSTGYLAAGRHYATVVAGYFLAINNTGDGCGAEPAGSTHFYTEYPCSPDSSIVVNDGGWHQIVGTFQGGVASLYVDGQFQGASSGTTLNPVSGVAFLVGGVTVAGTPANSFSGLVDNVAVWDNALTAGQVQSVYGNLGNPTVPEPGSLGLGFIGAALLVAYRRR